MNTSILAEDYYIWLLSFIESDDYKTSDYSLLLNKLFETEFYSIINYDDNRISDGYSLRDKYAEKEHIHLYYLADELPEYCSVLEVMIALAMRMEFDIMADDKYGDRTPLWFWTMVESLGLEDEYDRRYDDVYVTEVLDIFLERKYRKDGKGSLFWIKNMGQKLGQFDARGTEIWYQMNYFLNEIA